MARKFILISLATKIRVLFGLSVLGIIAAALVVPWYFTERLDEQGVQRVAEELTRLRLTEWRREHHQGAPAGRDETSTVVSLYAGRPLATVEKGPYFIRLRAGEPVDRSLDPPAREALETFLRRPDERLAFLRVEGDRGEPVYRLFRAVRSNPNCTVAGCHDTSRPLDLQFQPGELVGMIDVALPDTAGTEDLPWWRRLDWLTRLAFVIGGAMGTFVAILLFTAITQRLILRPIRSLRGLADRVADGDLSARSRLTTRDEFQRLGETFNQMLAAIDDQHHKLVAANKALDLKLHELAEANVTLFELNKVKDEFLTNVSHELRTPLNSIIGFADLLVESADERVARYGRNISAAAKNLLGMINDLLDLAKIEAGKAEVRLAKVSVLDVCQTLGALAQPLADKRHLTLELDLDETTPMVVTDAGKLQQILYNLLSNAIKFTPAGGKVTLSAAPSDTGEVRVAVADTGPGISEADQAHIFEKFYQADRTLTKESAGTGLGLAIAKELTNLLGGRLDLDSQPGKGTTFTLRLPVSPAGETAGGEETPQADP